MSSKASSLSKATSISRIKASDQYQSLPAALERKDAFGFLQKALKIYSYSSIGSEGELIIDNGVHKAESYISVISFNSLFMEWPWLSLATICSHCAPRLHVNTAPILSRCDNEPHFNVGTIDDLHSLISACIVDKFSACVVSGRPSCERWT